MKKKTLALFMSAFFSHHVAAGDVNSWSSPLSFDSSEEVANDWSESASSTSEESASKILIDFDNKESMLDIWQQRQGKSWKSVYNEKLNNRMFRSPMLAPGESSTLITEFMGEGGEISFDFRLKGRLYNTLTFYINDEQLLYVCEDIMSEDISRARFKLPEGERVQLKWVYTKYAASPNNQDFAFIDDISIDIDKEMDSDDDQFNDAWEFKYFGRLDAVDWTEHLLDWDGDGYSNWTEFQKRMDPTFHNNKSTNEFKLDGSHLDGQELIAVGKRLLNRGHLTEANQYFYAALNQKSDVSAFYHLGVVAETEFDDLNQAMHWYHLAAKYKHPQAMYRLYKFYIEGDSNNYNSEKAYKWLLDAAEHDYTDAYFQLGLAYEVGNMKNIDVSPTAVDDQKQQAQLWYREAVMAKAKDWKQAKAGLRSGWNIAYNEFSREFVDVVDAEMAVTGETTVTETAAVNSEIAVAPKADVAIDSAEYRQHYHWREVAEIQAGNNEVDATDYYATVGESTVDDVHVANAPSDNEEGDAIDHYATVSEKTFTAAIVGETIATEETVANAPSDDDVHVADAPSDDDVHVANAPSDHDVHVADAPSDDDVHVADAPFIGIAAGNDELATLKAGTAEYRPHYRGR